MAPLPKEARGAADWIQVFQRGDVGEAEFDECRDAQWARFGDVTEGASADVVVVGGIGERADAYAVENDPDYALNCGHTEISACFANFSIAEDGRS